SRIHGSCLPIVLSPTTRCARSSLWSFSMVHRDRLPYRFPRNPHGIGDSPVGCRLAAFTRPNRVRFARDRWFTSGCSPPHLAVTQLPSVSGPRTWTWRGLPPLRHKTLSGAHPCRLVRQVKQFVGLVRAAELLHPPDKPAGVGRTRAIFLSYRTASPAGRPVRGSCATS